MDGRSKGSILAAAVHLAAIASPSVSLAQAQTPSPRPVGPPGSTGNDVITMQNGGMLRGTVIEAIPDAQARIQLVTGEIVTVPWQQVVRIEHGAPAPPAPAPPAPTEEHEPPESEVWVHVDAPAGVLLQQDKTNDDRWVTVCSAPCDTLLPTTFYYRVTGASIRPSADLALGASPGTHERLVVHSASRAMFVLGVAGLTAGLVAAYVGLFVADAGNTQSPDGNGSTNASSGAGLATMGIGALVALGGLVLVLTNAKTTVTQDLGAQQAGAFLSSSWTRTPRWSTSATEATAPPPVTGIPILSGRF